VVSISGSINKEEFLTKLYLENYSFMVDFAGEFFRTQDIAEDVVQETFVIAQRKIDSLLASSKPVGWLMNALKNVIGTTYRRHNRLVQYHVPLDQDIADNMIFLKLQLKYGGVIEKEDLDLLIWIYCDDMPYQEAADCLNIKLDACKKRIQRAKEKFRKTMLIG
jgi:DNA-directed RNA polymerase specialized sigma24 family protein